MSPSDAGVSTTAGREGLMRFCAATATLSRWTSLNVEGWTGVHCFYNHCEWATVTATVYHSLQALKPFDEEALRVVRLLEAHFTPATWSKVSPQECRFTCRVSFSRNESRVGCWLHFTDLILFPKTFLLSPTRFLTQLRPPYGLHAQPHAAQAALHPRQPAQYARGRGLQHQKPPRYGAHHPHRLRAD